MKSFVRSCVLLTSLSPLAATAAPGFARIARDATLDRPPARRDRQPAAGAIRRKAAGFPSRSQE